MDPLQYWLIVVFTLGGGVSVVGAWKDWDLFMESRRARRFVEAVGRQGARWIYGGIGGILILIGLAFLVTGPEALAGG